MNSPILISKNCINDILEHLPDPATLNKQQVDSLFMTLREARIETMQRISSIFRDNPAQCNDPGLMIDRLEAQAQLQEIINYMRCLQIRIKQLERWIPVDQHQPVFEDYKGDHKSWVAARGRCPLTPDSVLFLHGPVTLFFIASLAEHLLSENETLSCLKKIKFVKELAHEPDILIWDDSSGKPPVDVINSDIAFQGYFVTSRGRKLMFTAAPNVKHPAQLKADYHPIVNCVAQHPPVHDVNTGCVRYTYPIDAWPPKGSQITGAAALFAIMEFFVTTVLQALDDGHSTYLFTTLANRDIPADFGQWTQSKPELQVDLDWEHKRTVPGRGFFVPGRYRMYPKDETWTKGSLVCLDNNITF